MNVSIIFLFKGILNYDFARRLNTVVEFRYNKFLPKRDRLRIGVGLEYKFF